MKMSFAVKRVVLWIFFCLFTLTESVFMNGPQKSQQSQLENAEGASSSRHLYEKRKQSDEFEASSSSEFERRQSTTV